MTRHPATVDTFFLHSQDEMLKTQRFFNMFHLWKAFREYIFLLRGPIQNEERRNDHFFGTPGPSLT